MRENLTIVTFLTCGEHPHQIFFVHAKAVSSHYSRNQKHWYAKRGEKGEANWVWQEKEIKQWSFAAQDPVARQWIEDIVTKGTIKESFKNKEVVFKSAYNQLGHQKQKTEWGGLPSLLHEYPEKWISKDSFDPISILVDEPGNIDFLEGYKRETKINPLLPFRLFPEGFLKECITQKVFVYHHPRSLNFFFKGDRNGRNAEGNTLGLMGRCLEDRSFKESYEVVCLGQDEMLLGRSSINQDDGSWYIETIAPANKGLLLLRNLQTGAYGYASRFVLIKNIQINTRIIGTTITNSFGKSYDLSENEKKSFSPIKAYSWQLAYFPNGKEAKTVLSEVLSSMLCSLGKHAVLNDPYLLGFISGNGELKLNESQALFFEALAVALARAGTETLTLIGRWEDVRKSFSEESNAESKEQLLRGYQQILLNIKSKFSGTYFQLRSLKIMYPAEKFHDRFWASIDDQGQVQLIYHVSSSVSAYVENGELMILPLQEGIFNKIRSKIERRLQAKESQTILIEENERVAL